MQKAAAKQLDIEIDLAEAERVFSRWRFGFAYQNNEHLEKK